MWNIVYWKRWQKFKALVVVLSTAAVFALCYYGFGHLGWEGRDVISFGITGFFLLLAVALIFEAEGSGRVKFGSKDDK